MKRLILLSIMFAVALGVSAQNGNLKSPTTPFDTLNGSETVYFPVVTVTGDYSNLAITALCSNIGGTSDGTLVLQYSAGANYETVSQTTGLFEFITNDTLTIVDAAAWNVIIPNPAPGSYRIKGAGTASDTTLVTPQYRLK